MTRVATPEELEEGAAVCEQLSSLLERGLAGELARTRKPAPSSLEPLRRFAEHYRDMGFIGSPLGATPEIVGTYLATMITDGQSKAAVRAAHDAIAYAFDIEGLAPPTGHSLVRATMKLNTERARLPAETKPEGTEH